VRDVVEDVVTGEALRLAVETAGDYVVTLRVMVENPGRQADGGIHDPVESLWTERHLVGVTQAELVEEGHLVPGVLLVRQEAVRRRAATRERLGHFRGYGRRHVGGDGEQLRRRLETHGFGNGIAPVPALRHEFLVAEALHQRRPGAGDATRLP